MGDKRGAAGGGKKAGAARGARTFFPPPSRGSVGIAFILYQTELTSICFEKRFFQIILKQYKDGKLQHLKNLCCFESIDDEMKL